MIKKISPFRLCVMQNFPYIEQDFDALTDYGLMCKIVEYLNKVIEQQNLTGTKVNELVNWFNNLDVQDEIDVKLNKMAEDGTLAEIINQEIFSNINNDISSLKNRVTNLENRKFIFFGDSYASGEIGSSWLLKLVNYMGIAGENYVNASRNGYGFTYPSSTQNFESVLDYYISILENKESYTDIVVAGGYNDGANYNEATEEDIENAISSFISKAKLNFPNAKITIAHIGWTQDCSKWKRLRETSITAYKNCGKYGASYITNSEFIMHNYTLYLSDTFHPNDNGTTNIAKYLVNGLLNGSCDVYYEIPITLNNRSDVDIVFSNCDIISITHNEITSIEFRNKDTNNVLIQSNSTNGIQLNAFSNKEIASIDSFATCYCGQNQYKTNIISTNCYITDTDNTSKVIPILINVYNYVISFINMDTVNHTVKFIGLQPFTIKQLSLYC